MQRFLFEFIELFSFLGAGTPENPGGDFTMYCWIDAPDRDAALRWGHVLLGGYCRARYARAADGSRHDGSPLRKGAIVEVPELLARALGWRIPTCQVGELPRWHEPWRHTNVG
jgi:hypothetical protein